MTITEDTKKKMEASIEHFQDELRKLRTGCANPSILDSVMVESYGTAMRLKDIANVSVSEARQLLVTPFDPQVAGPISKGIEKAGLNLQPILEGNLVRVPIPPMNEDVRKDIVKQAKKKAEDSKVSIRDHRRKANDTAKKQKSDGDMTEDILKKTEKQVQELTDQYCKKIDELCTAKEKDILEV